MFLIIREAKVIRSCIILRIIVSIILIVLSIFPDHDADAFKPPKEKPVGFLNRIVHLLFNGISKWDAVYFTFIAKWGYVYEKSLAFFPLLPFIVGYFARLGYLIFGSILSLDSLILIVGFQLNFVLSILASLQLYRLGLCILGLPRVSMLAALIYSVNPAGVFFSVIYSEPIFFLFTVTGLLQLESGRPWKAALCFLLTTSSRSNGLLNCGYLMYRPFLTVVGHIRRLTNARTVAPRRHVQSSNVWVRFVTSLRVSFAWWRNLFNELFPCICQVAVCIAPFLIFQVYGYLLYCDTQLPSQLIPRIPNDELVSYAASGQFRLPVSVLVLLNNGSENNDSTVDRPTWCNDVLPLPYTHIQRNFWNVGLMRYFTIKQLPNFILAAPVLLLGILTTAAFCARAPRAYRTLGVMAETVVDRRLVPYAYHLFFICVYGVTHIHVQVLTRMIFSSCPLIYWYAAFFLNRPGGGSLVDSATSVDTTSSVSSMAKRRSPSFCTGHSTRRRGFAAMATDKDGDDKNKVTATTTKEVAIFADCWIADTVELLFGSGGGSDVLKGREVGVLNPASYTEWRQRAFVVYCLGYTLVGCALHSNFLPWT